MLTEEMIQHEYEKAARDCDCEDWEYGDHACQRLRFLGNGHHPACPHFIATVGAIQLLTGLVNAIERMDRRGMNVSSELWYACQEAVFVLRGAHAMEER